MKVVDNGKILDKLCDYLNSHKKETRIKIVRENNTEAILQEDKWFGLDLGDVEIDEDYKNNQELTFSMWKGNITNKNIDFSLFKNLLKTFEIKNKTDVTIEMK